MFDHSSFKNVTVALQSTEWFNKQTKIHTFQLQKTAQHARLLGTIPLQPSPNLLSLVVVEVMFALFHHNRKISVFLTLPIQAHPNLSFLTI